VARRLRPIHLGIAGACLLVLAGGAAFAVTRGKPPGHPAARPVASTQRANSDQVQPEGRPRLSVDPPDGTSGVPLDSPVTVTVSSGQLLGVSVTASTGAATPGSLITPGPEPATGPTSLPGELIGSTWAALAPLEPGASYTVAATVSGPHGATTRLTSTFSTLTPAKLLKIAIAPLNGQTVGVGMPIALYLSQPVTNHAAFESRVQVTTDPPVAGAWHWFSDTEVHYRPQAYWPSGTLVSLDGQFAGWDVGNGVWSVTPRHLSFTIGGTHISTVDASTHEMTVTDGGNVVKVIAVSTGRDKYPTDSGIHVVSEKDASVVMDSATVGIPRNSPDGYYETVLWDVRISNSGEFVHAAPWSVASQGHSNVSHGCVNVSPADAQWFFNFSRPGDIVSVVGTPTTLAPTNGFGDWNVAWAQWANG
jgi:lipoprotein-anchoring transpeptidase ErfK/SrfK